MNPRVLLSCIHPLESPGRQSHSPPDGHTSSVVVFSPGCLTVRPSMEFLCSVVTLKVSNQPAVKVMAEGWR